MSHQLHKTIGKIIKANFSEKFSVILDQACGGKQNIPLFTSKKKSRITEICDVDILILKNGKIKVIFEIEESGVGPTQVCGKFLTSALSSYYIDKEDSKFPMDNSVLFVQILDTSKLNEDKTSKTKQWENLEKSIQNVIPIKKSKIKRYKNFYGNVTELRNKVNRKKELTRYIQEFLGENS